MMPKLNRKYIFVVTMYRWGDIESHSYIEGVYSTARAAEFNGELEQDWRDNKYDAIVTKHIIDTPNENRKDD